MYPIVVIYFLKTSGHVLGFAILIRAALKSLTYVSKNASQVHPWVWYCWVRGCCERQLQEVMPNCFPKRLLQYTLSPAVPEHP